jgi:hypothetical protein
MIRLFFLFVTMLTFTSCQKRYGEFIRYHDDGRMKPRVALLPLIDHSAQDLPWDVSEELTTGMSEKLKRNGDIFLTSPDQVSRGFGTQSSEEWVATELPSYRLFAPDNDFVVQIELLEHRKEPYSGQKVQPVYPSKGTTGAVLMMTLHVKVVDIRNQEPRIVLSQYIHSNHLIPQSRMDFDYRQIPWSTRVYKETPVGRAHARLERDIVEQLEQYITYHVR